MVLQLVFITALAVFFFLVIPGAGAFYVRTQWRRFRKTVVDSTFYPYVRYRNVHSAKDGFLGMFRFSGTLEALEENRVWLKGANVTISARMERCQMFIIPSITGFEDDASVDESPKKIAWRNIFTLPEGTKVFISGALFCRNGKVVFESIGGGPLLVIIYDGPEETILQRAIRAGRQRNEYWNQFTLPSLIAGFFALLFLGYILFRNGADVRLAAILSLNAGLLPLVGFFPPGIVGILIFRYFWRKARLLRADRDLLTLPLRCFPRFSGKETMELADIDGELPYCVFRFRSGDIQTVRSRSVPEPELRYPGFLSLTEVLQSEDFYLFCSYLPSGETGQFILPLDPMEEMVLIPGNPEELSEKCSRLARRFEYLSTGSFVLGLLINSFFVFSILRILLR